MEEERWERMGKKGEIITSAEEEFMVSLNAFRG